MLLLLALVSIHTNFEGGSLGRVQQVTPTHFRLGAKGESDQDGRNRQANWYYFRVDGAPKTDLTLDMVDLPGEYNYQPNRGAITKDTPPVISYDRKTWTHIETFEYDAAEPRLRLRVRPQAKRFWIAHCPPYTNEHLLRLRNEVRRHPAFQEEIVGKTVGGRDMRLWTIANAGTSAAKPTIWLMFRQHSWESGSSWVGEGAVRALLATSPEAEELRSRYTWKIFPLCDPDGVARGGVRFNAHGFDLNRNWDVHDPTRMPEIAAQKAAIRTWTQAGHRIALFLSLHNTETSEYLQGPPNDGAPIRPLAERLFTALTAKTTFDASRPLFFAESTTTPGKPGRMTAVQGLYAELQIAGFLMEQRVSHNPKLGHLPTLTDRLQFGRQLVAALASAID